MRNNNGFTLIELIVTISIMILLLTITVPRFDISFGYMEKMINEFAMDVRNVQMENMKTPSAGYDIKIYSDKYYIRKNMDIEKIVNFKDGYTINYNNGDSISFTYDGEPKKAGTFTITNTRNSKVKQVSIVPVTGRTIILE